MANSSYEITQEGEEARSGVLPLLEWIHGQRRRWFEFEIAVYSVEQLEIR